MSYCQGCADRERELQDARAALAASDRALLDAWTGWSFGGIDGQQHTHNWHDREDWCERHAAAIASARARAQEAGCNG